MDGCLSCAPGTYSDTGSAYCATAGAGNRTNDDRTGMLVCPVNTFSTGSADACSPCTNGGHSQPGSSSCEKCDTGTCVRASEAKREKDALDLTLFARRYYDRAENDCFACLAGCEQAQGGAEFHRRQHRWLVSGSDLSSTAVLHERWQCNQAAIQSP